jgi:kinesin family protein 2/24
MAQIHDVEKPGSEIEGYVSNMEKIFNQQIEKITSMKNRLINFKNLLKEEEELSQKFLKIQEFMDSQFGESFHSQSIISKNEGINNLDMDDNF